LSQFLGVSFWLFAISSGKLELEFAANTEGGNHSRSHSSRRGQYTGSALIGTMWMSRLPSSPSERQYPNAGQNKA
jgi:hypothetical protein